MRVLIADRYYGAFLSDHYARHAELAERPYGEQLASLLDQGFGTGDAYAHELRGLGHEAGDVILNCEPLQFRWAAEHRARGAGALSAAGRLPGRPGALA